MPCHTHLVLGSNPEHHLSFCHLLFYISHWIVKRTKIIKKRPSFAHIYKNNDWTKQNTGKRQWLVTGILPLNAFLSFANFYVLLESGISFNKDESPIRIQFLPESVALTNPWHSIVNGSFTRTKLGMPFYGNWPLNVPMGDYNLEFKYLFFVLPSFLFYIKPWESNPEQSLGNSHFNVNAFSANPHSSIFVLWTLGVMFDCFLSDDTSSNSADGMSTCFLLSLKRRKVKHNEFGAGSMFNYIWFHRL